ncbi:MAG TPA: PQQ-binding-like beta-propeller repeat protein, partial [Bryobacteraceae bacterium]|nr:PQQ-binding-like beta-propeller repeat protein [Bryobacteraceae bacterium]
MLTRIVLSLIGLVSCAAFDTASAQVAVNVTTHHNDTFRTGWNSNETVLNASNVNSILFGVLAQTAVDDQVDAQPLVFNNVVYVVTENNTIYAIDAVAGTVLQSLNLGAPVPQNKLPGGCTNNANHVGISSTPVIDVTASVMYVVTYTYENNNPVYRIHEISLPNLTEITNTEITAAALLSDGQTVLNFTPQYQRQRAALLEANGNIYAAFASFCDLAANASRGWVLGWNAGTLTPLPANEMTNTQTNAQTPQPGTTNSKFNNFFLSSVWMSGYGIATDSSGDLFFTTGNSNTVQANNIQESVVRLSSDLTTVKDYFTPYNFEYLEGRDWDFGSGGLMVLPDQPGPVPHLAVAAGKSGYLYTMDRDPGMLGGYVPGGPDKPTAVVIHNCWCGPSYYVGADGIGRIVSSGGFSVYTYTINTAKKNPLTFEAKNTLPTWEQDQGFFTSISSNGTQAGSAVIWAVSRPIARTAPFNVSLYAFNAAAISGSLPQIYSAVAGTWPNVGGNANIVPTVANGRVYVASYKMLTMFGLLPSQMSPQSKVNRVPSVQAQSLALSGAANTAQSPSPAGSRIFGTIMSVDGDQVVVQLRSGKNVTVDLTEALKRFRSVIPSVGEHVEVRGSTEPGGTMT